MEDKSLWQRIVDALDERKVDDLVALDVSEMCSFTSSIVICSGKSDRQVKSLAEHLIEKIGKPAGKEGIEQGRWALLDYMEVVVHIFQEDERRYYNIEGMWLKAKRLTG